MRHLKCGCRLAAGAVQRRHFRRALQLSVDISRLVCRTTQTQPVFEPYTAHWAPTKSVTAGRHPPGALPTWLKVGHCTSHRVGKLMHAGRPESCALIIRLSASGSAGTVGDSCSSASEQGPAAGAARRHAAAAAASSSALNFTRCLPSWWLLHCLCY